MSKRWLSLFVVAVGLQGWSARAAPPEAAAQPTERRLHVASAEASSYLINDWNKFQENYLPLYVGDDDPKTAWTLKTEGIGEWLRVHVSPMAGATKVRLRVRNGYQKSDKLWAANSRAKGLTVVLLPSKKTVDVELTDKQGWQELAIDQPAGPLEAVELRVRSVYAGKKYDDLCLSDVQLYVTATTSDNPAFEKQRLQKIVDWKKERLAAAALFKTELGRSLPIASQYRYIEQNPPREQPRDDARPSFKCPDQLCSLRESILGYEGHAGVNLTAGLKASAALARASFAGMTAVHVSSRDKRTMPRVDGICTVGLAECAEDPCSDRLPLPGELGFLNAQSLVTTEQAGLPTVRDVVELKLPACKRADATTFAWVARDAPAADGTPGAIRALLLAMCGSVESREGSYPAVATQLLTYGADGALDSLATPNLAATLMWSRDGDGAKLARAEVLERDAYDPASYEAVPTTVAGK